MLKEFKDELVEVVKSSTEVLNDEDALAIMEICKRAVNREIANVSEEYLTESLERSDNE